MIIKIQGKRQSGNTLQQLKQRLIKEQQALDTITNKDLQKIQIALINGIIAKIENIERKGNL